MKRLILSLLLIPCISCLTTSEVYLPHTSRIFHKKSCVGLHDPNPIVYTSARAALSTGGVAACSVCIKDKDLAMKHQGYTVTNYATPGSNPGSSNSQKLPPAKSKSSVAIRVLGDILVLLGLATLVAISASATPAQTYTPAPNFTVQPSYSSSNYSTPSSVFSTTGTSSNSNYGGGTTYHSYSDGTTGTSSNYGGGTTYHSYSDGTTGTSSDYGGGTTYHSYSDGTTGTSSNYGGGTTYHNLSGN